MNRNLKLILGFILIFIGAGCLLKIADINVVSFGGFTHAVRLLWPLALVVLGIYFVTDSKIIRTMSVILFMLAIIAGTVYYSMTVDRNIFTDHNDHSVFDYDDEYDDFFDWFD